MVSIKFDMAKVGAFQKEAKNGDSYVCIPLDDIQVTEKGHILEVNLAQKKSSDYDDTHSVILSKNTNPDRDTVFVGSARDFDMENPVMSTPSTPAPTESSVPSENGYETSDDLPF